MLYYKNVIPLGPSLAAKLTEKSFSKIFPPAPNENLASPQYTAKIWLTSIFGQIMN